MTILVATTSGIWADRRVSNGPQVFPPWRKIVRGAGLVAGFCGDNSACAKAMAAVKAGETDPQALADMCDGLLVNDRGAWELCNKLAVRAPAKTPFITNGSGWAEAQAFLSGSGDISDEGIRRALRYVAKVRSDCGDGCNGLWL
jgi:hypothetical protein